MKLAQAERIQTFGFMFTVVHFAIQKEKAWIMHEVPFNRTFEESDEEDEETHDHWLTEE